MAILDNAPLMENIKAATLAVVAAGLVSFFLTPAVRKLAISKGVVDDPNQDDRRVHKEPTPRWGGLAIYAGIVLSAIVTLMFRHMQVGAYMWGIFIIGSVLVVVGALDDLYQYKAKIQAAVLLLAGVAIQFFDDGVKNGRVQIQGFDVPFSANYIHLGLAAIPLTAIYIFVVTKTMDTIDGIDGLTAGIATIAAGTLTLIALFEGQGRVAILTAAICGASLGFLRHNYNPAKIFMGTGGAYVLGSGSQPYYSGRRLAAGGDVIVPEITHAYALGPLLAKYVTGDATDIASGLGTVQKNVYSMWFSSKPEDGIFKGHSTGFVRLTGLERLTVTFASALSADYVIDVIGYQFANMSNDAVGNVKRTVVS